MILDKTDRTRLKEMVSNFEDAVELDYMPRDVIPSPLLLEEGIEVCSFPHPGGEEVQDLLLLLGQLLQQ